MTLQVVAKIVLIEKYFLKKNKNDPRESIPYGNNQQPTGSSRSIYQLPEDSSTSVALLQSQYQCDRCLLNFKDLLSLQRHENNWHQMTQIKCRLCLNEFTDRRNAHMHIRYLHNHELNKLHLAYNKGLLPSKPTNQLIERIINKFNKRRARHVGKMSNAVRSQLRSSHMYSAYNSVAPPRDASPAQLAYTEAVSVSDLLSIRLTGLRIDTPEHANNSTGATTTAYNANAPATSVNGAATSANAASTNANTPATNSDVLSVNLTSLHITAPVTSHTS